MAPPKHLWSGDWEAQSTDKAPRQPAYVAVPEAESPAPEPAPGAPWYRRSGPLGALGGLVVVLIAVGVVLAVTLPGGSHSPAARAQVPTQNSGSPNSGGQGLTPTLTQQSPSPTQTTPQQTSPQQQATTPTQPAQVNAGPTYNWLGMQINATSSGVTVGSVAANSAADEAGVNPGDVIASVNSAQISSVAQLQSVTEKLKVGARFQLVVDRGTEAVTLTATLTGRPAKAS